MIISRPISGVVWFIYPYQTWLQYIPRNMHTVFALLCFVVVIHWLIFPYPSGLLHWHCGNLTIAPVPAKQPWWNRINTSCECIMDDCITTTKQSTTKPCAYFLGYTVLHCHWHNRVITSKVLFHSNISPSGEQPEHRKLDHELEQPTSDCIAIFHKYCC